MVKNKAEVRLLDTLHNKFICSYMTPKLCSLKWLKNKSNVYVSDCGLLGCKPCNLLGQYHCFPWTCCFHFQGIHATIPTTAFNIHTTIIIHRIQTINKPIPMTYLLFYPSSSSISGSITTNKHCPSPLFLSTLNTWATNKQVYLADIRAWNME